MTPEQRLRMAELAEKLADVVLQDANPDNWAGQGKTLAKMDATTRGDACWCRKTAAQSVALLVRVEGLLEADDGKPSEPDPEVDIKRAEDAAKRALSRALTANA